MEKAKAVERTAICPVSPDEQVIQVEYGTFPATTSPTLALHPPNAEKGADA